MNARKPTSTMQRCLILAAIWLCALCCMESAWATPPAAGTLIKNTASATFIDSKTGFSATIVSNTVQVDVAPLEGCTLSAGQNITRAPGASFALPHTLTNTGNTSETCLLTATVPSGAGYTPTKIEVVEDSNGNGVADAGEPVIPAGSGITIAAGASINLLITGQVPASVVPGQTAAIVLTATGSTQHVSATSTDNVAVTSGAALSVSKSASTTKPTPGSLLTYTLSVINQGNIAATGTTVSVDGATQTLVMLRDAIPANTTFQNLATATNATRLYHRLGDAASTYVSTLPSGVAVDGIAWGVPSLAAGATLSGQLTVTVNSNAAGTLDNIGYSDYVSNGSAITSPSNEVQLTLPADPASVSFFSSGSYVNPVLESSLSAPIYLQINASVCNTDATTVQTYQLHLSTSLGKDQESFSATETSPNSGIFRVQPSVQTADARTHPVVTGDGVLELLPNDVVTATLVGCAGAGTLTATITIAPQSVVYDSKTNLPISGAVVTLFDSSGAPAKVYEADGVTLASNTATTGTDGSFSFAMVLPGTYAFKVTPPTGYSFPSKIPQAQQPAGRILSTPGSYGGSFTVGSKGPIQLDIPLDASVTGGLIVEKTVSQASAQIGEFVDYTVTVTNHSGATLSNVQLNDWLPAGFEYSHGSARLQAHAIAEPKLSGGTMAFALGGIVTNSSEVLTYRVAIAPGAQNGNGINTAQAQSGSLRSNLAQVKVDLTGGVFTDNAILIGKVFADCNGNRIQDSGEPGIPGVRIWLADGTYAITDGEGKYSLYGLTPRTTVAAVDPTTLPDGATLELLNHRNAFDPGSQFVDLQNGELHKTDFAITQCTPDIRAAIAARRKALNQPQETLAVAQNLLTTQQTISSTVDDRSLPASGTLGLTGITADGTSVTTPNVMSNASTIMPLGAIGDMGGSIAQQSPAARPLFPDTPIQQLTSEVPSAQTLAQAAAVEQTLAVKSTQTVALTESLPHLDAKLDFINLQNEQIMPSDQTRVQVKGPAGATFQLSVNGVVIPATQVGTRASLASKGISAWEYIGVDLRPGNNTLELSALDSFGNARGHQSITVRAPGPVAALRIVLPTKAIADAQTAALITVQPVDANGLPVATRLPITLVASQGTWQVKDLNASEPGTQVFVEGGAGVYPLLSPANPGTALITVTSGNIEASAKLVFSPNLRPLFGVGIVEGVLNLSKLDPHSIQPTQSTDAFETEITSVSNSFDDGKATAAARSEVFLKGKVLGSTLLTLGYDSNKPADTQLFRDIQPDQYYPIYGDSSVKGFDAQSTGKLYVRLDHGTSFLLLGDYTTQSDNPARQLTQYSRALNGLKGRAQDGPLTVDGFAAHTSSTQVVTEIQGNGTSGPYQLNLNGVINSQQVDLVTRDRTQPGVVIADKPLTPFVDYTIENYTGRLLFMAPVPAVDSNLNPVFIRVTYEVDLGGPKHMVGGVDATYQLTHHLAVGGTAIRDDDPTNHQDLDGINMTAQLGAKSTLVGEVAQSDTTDQGRGEAERLEWRTQGPQLQGRLWGIHSDSAFYNPSALQSAGQSQYGMQLGYLLDPKDRIAIEGLRSVTPLAGGSQNGESASLQHSLPGNMKLSVGIRHADGAAQTTAVDTTGNLPASTPVDFTSVFARLDTPVPYVPKANVFTQYERALNEDAAVTSLGGTYALGNAGKLYLTHESNNSLSGAYGLNPNVNQYSTVFGFQTAMANQTQLFNEYRIGDSIDGRSAEDAVGLRHMFQIEPGFGISASAERIKPVSGEVTDESEAITTAVSYTASDMWKASGRLEWRDSQTSRSWLATAAVATKLDDNWTLLNRGLYSSTDDHAATGDDATIAGDATSDAAVSNVGPGTQHLAQVQSGFAYRPTDSDVWNALGMIGYKRDQDSTLPIGQQLDERDWMVLTQVNVQPSATWDVSARYAAEHAVDLANGITTVGWTQLLGARAIKDIAERWDLGGQAYTSWGLGTRRYAVGMELGYLVRRNLWVSVGYNILGFNDPDLSGGAYTQDGIYLRLRFKFGGDPFDQVGDLHAAAPGRANAAAALMSGAQAVQGQP